jgi:iron-sulfur cluster assembly accessory protein
MKNAGILAESIPTNDSHYGGWSRLRSDSPIRLKCFEPYFSEGEGAMLRISVEGGGCSGFQYKFDIERAQSEDDLVIERDNAVVLVDPASVPFLAGSEVDFVDDLIGASFRVVNPNATASCGCGTSFSI